MKPVLFALLVGAILAAGLTACGEERSPNAAPQTGDTTSDEAPAPPPPVAMPIALRIPSINLTAHDWVELGQQTSGEIEVPDVKHPGVLGLYCPSWKSSRQTDCGAPVPGQTGPAVIAGHVDGGGKAGVFKQLPKVKVGDRVEIDLSDGYTARYRVTDAVTVSKQAFPTERVYDNTPTAQLRLVTCTGRLDRAAHRYLDQRIVFAELTELSPTGDLRPAR